MNCPKCGKENPDDTQICRFCNAPMTETLELKQPVTVKVSKLAGFSLTCALCGLALIVPALFSAKFPRTLSPRTDWVVSTFLIGLLIIAVSLILGVVSIIRIERSGGKITGRLFANLSVLVPVLSVLSSFWFIASHQSRSVAFTMVCGTNLSGIGKAMIIYSNDYEDEFPRAGGRNSTWSSSIPDWLAENRYDAYGLSADGSGGRATISSSFYLLVKYAEVTPKSFICGSETGVTEFNPKKYGVRDKELIDLWDFGPEPKKHYSYSYHMPYGLYALTSSSESGMAVAADRNPWMKAPVAKLKNFAKFDPDGDKKAINVGNSSVHKGDGQNVLFLDGHVSFEKVSFCGINDDNIYTYWNDGDIRKGGLPMVGMTEPQDRLDSFLVNDQP
jgi:prepilin-type processing-associated H-X9-DG protein